MDKTDIGEMNREIELLKKENDRLRNELAQAASLQHADEYLHLLDSIDIHVFYLSSPDRYGLVNRAHAEFFGASKGDLEHKNLFDVLPESEAEVCVAGNVKIFEQQETIVTEEVMRRADGEERLFSFTKTPMLNEQGDTAYVICTGEDITDRKQAERLLTFTQFTIDQAKMAVFWCHADGHFFYVNKTACEWLEYSFDELKNMHVADINPEFPRSAWSDHWEEIRRKGIVKMESVHQRKSGEVYPVEIFSNYVQFEGEEYKLAFVSDISEKVAAREAAEQSRIFLENILESIQDGICVLDTDLNIVMANKVMRGWCQGETDLLGQKCSQAYHDSGSVCNNCPTRRAISTGSPESDIKPGKQGTGVEWFEVHSYPIKDPETEKVMCVVEFVRDITDRLKLERQLSQAQKMEAIGTLSGGIAHDFNNLLQMMLGSVQLMGLQKDSEHPDMKYLDMFEKSIHRAQDLTSRLLFLSRDMESDLKPVDLNMGVEQIVKLISGTLPKMISIQRDYEASLKPILADIVQIEQVILNLAINASQAMPEGGELSIQTALITMDEVSMKANPEFKTGEYVVLTLSDTGGGMSQETMNRMYEPFFSTKPAGKGTGLGLSMVYGIVRNHGGVITCYSTEEVGTTFKLYFPAIQESVQEELTPDRPQIRGGKETVLVVDDEEMLRVIACQFLKEFGYTALKAESGEAALELLQQHRNDVDLVILDLNMPGMGGRKCLEQIGGLPEPPPVIVASGYKASGFADVLVDLGARAFLGKPYQMKEFLETVREVLD